MNKKRICFACVSLCFLTIGIAFLFWFKKNYFIIENIESLSTAESEYHGRWRTVGCGSYLFEDWKTCCCPNLDYDNCPGQRKVL